jgi:dihydrofolate synthase/folylpolyglutamate synthase
VAAALAAILHQAGFSVGLYTSPHLIRFNERIRINNNQISNSAVVQAYRAVRRVHSGERQPTFFEFATAMALFEFGRRKVDWAIIETGMGGRFDATNVIEPALCVITNISLEHREYLGNTLSQIAREKAGIIKDRVAVVTAVKQKQAISVIHKTAKQKKATPYQLGKEFKVKRNSNASFSYYGIDNKWTNLRTCLAGDHQISNAALALAAIELLNRKGGSISLAHIQKGLANISWPGRLDIVCNNPLILLDGAHNLIAARNLARYLATHLAGRKISMIIGILDDKPYEAMLKSLLPVAYRTILTRAKIDRALDPQQLKAVAKDIISDISIMPDVAQAVKYAVDSAGDDEAICIAGSLYVVGEAMEAFEKGLIKPKAKKIRR